MSTIRMLSWNVNGLRAAYKKGFKEWFAEAGPDILCLQETKSLREQLPGDLQSIEGYQAHFSSAEKKGYSGVALYTKRAPNHVETGFGVEEFDSEGRIIIAHYDEFALFDIYFPNGRRSVDRLEYKMRFYDAFLEAADRLKGEGRGIVVCGDVNTAHKEIDLARPGPNSNISGFLPEERAWMDELVDHGYLDTFRMFSDESEHYTYWDQMTRARDRNVGWRIDYFFVSEGLACQVRDAFILSDVMGSDHCPIGIDLDV
jgi:exodeoxyribonuclease-3